MPSTSAALTLARSLTSLRTAAASPFLTASTSGGTAGAALKLTGQQQHGRTSDHTVRRRPDDATFSTMPSYSEAGCSSSGTMPSLSPNLSRSTPTRSSIVKCTFASGVGWAYLMCRPPFSLPGASRDDNRQVQVIVHIRVAHAAAEHDDRVIEQRAVAVGRGLQLLEVIGEQRHVIGVDLRQLLQLLRIVAVMRRRVVRLGHADLRIGARADFARHLERDDARHVGLQREHLQVEHQLDVLFPRRRGTPTGRVDDPAAATRRLCCSAFWMRRSTSRTRIEILVHLRAVAGAEPALQAGHFVASPQSSMLPFLRSSARRSLGRAAVAEQTLEHHARVGFGRQRRRRRRPRRLFMYAHA